MQKQIDSLQANLEAFRTDSAEDILDNLQEQNTRLNNEYTELREEASTICS